MKKYMKICLFFLVQLLFIINTSFVFATTLNNEDLEFFENYLIGTFILNLILTIILYMGIPLYLHFTKKNFSNNKEVRNIVIANSVGIYAFYFVIYLISQKLKTPNLVPPFFYGLINYNILKKHINNNEIAEKKINSKYFCIENCAEIQKLVTSWKSKNIYTEEYRIKELKDYDILETATAKIIFLFNLLLDVSDIYIKYRVYMKKTKEINQEYIKNSECFMKKYEACFKKISEILIDLKEEPYFKDYKDSVSIVWIDFGLLYDILNVLYKKSESLLMFGKQTKEIINATEIEIIQLVNVTETYNAHLENLQLIISQNRVAFEYLKDLDSKRYIESELNKS